MKVKDVLAIREKKQKEFANLQKLEKLFCNNKELRIVRGELFLKKEW